MNYQEDVELTPKPTIGETLEAIRAAQAEQKLDKTIFYGLSDLTKSEIDLLKPVWDALVPAYRQKIIKQMIEISEVNIDLNYQTIGEFTLNDADSLTRQSAIELLWEDESLAFMNKLIDMAQWDESTPVRAAAISALGRFILLGEHGEISENAFVLAQDTAINLWTNDNEEIEVRRRALEAIANSSNPIVVEAIREAYNSHDSLLQTSAVFAMGRSCDKRWEKEVLREMDSTTEEMRFEAARAAGELELAAAVPRLTRMAQEEDADIRDIAIWSLGEIGGREALRALEQLAEHAYAADDDSLTETIEDAIAMASLVGGDLPVLFDVDDATEFSEDDYD